MSAHRRNFRSGAKRVIINADDLGMSRAINRAISVASQKGVLTSASIMANMPAYEDAVRNTIARSPKMGVGIHICLTEGAPVLDPREIPLLVNGKGMFRNGFIGLFLKNRSERVMEQVRAEVEAQCERVRSDGIEIDHINGHHHVHMIPRIFECVQKVGEVSGCRGIRLPDERFEDRLRKMGIRYVARSFARGNILKKVLLSALSRRNRHRLSGMRCPDYCYGVLDSGGVDKETLRRIVNCVKPGITEIITHPGLLETHNAVGKEPGKGRPLDSQRRQMELEAVLSEMVRDDLESSDIRLISFGEIGKYDGE